MKILRRGAVWLTLKLLLLLLLLGQNQIHFVPEFVGPFLEMALIPEPNVRKSLMPIFFEMMLREWENSNSFSKVCSGSSLTFLYLTDINHGQSISAGVKCMHLLNVSSYMTSHCSPVTIYHDWWAKPLKTHLWLYENVVILSQYC